MLLQRVQRASVSVEGEVVGRIGPGLLLFVGVGQGDTDEHSSYLASKIANLRIFHDDTGRMNLSLLDAGGGALVVSQFTLFADVRKGRRPSFTRAADPDDAAQLVDHFVGELDQLGVTAEQGIFGAMMAVDLVNDGPVTIWLDTSELMG
ncbi:D-aminoacyl-tRNA deacylase [soil metagenome]